jgi:hypothetical protein
MPAGQPSSPKKSVFHPDNMKSNITEDNPAFNPTKTEEQIDGFIRQQVEIKKLTTVYKDVVKRDVNLHKNQPISNDQAACFMKVIKDTIDKYGADVWNNSQELAVVELRQVRDCILSQEAADDAKKAYERMCKEEGVRV